MFVCVTNCDMYFVFYLRNNTIGLLLLDYYYIIIVDKPANYKCSSFISNKSCSLFECILTKHTHIVDILSFLSELIHDISCM